MFVKAAYPDGGKVKTFRKFAEDQDGATAIEYAVMAGVLGLLIAGGVSILGESNTGAMAMVVGRVKEALGQ